MIVTVTLNAAVDVTYEVERLTADASHRVRTVHERAGGKGVNVARVLHDLGYAVLATGLAGGDAGDFVRADLTTARLDHQLVPIAGRTRRTVAVVEDGSGNATVFNEPGPVVAADEWERFLRHYRELVGPASAVALCGSLPPGVPADSYAALVGIAHEHLVPVVLDTSGEALTRALSAAPDVVKPNLPELLETTGAAEPRVGAEVLMAAGARAAVVTMGESGMHAVTPRGHWRGWTSAPVSGNPTGAGDACVAALVSGLAGGHGWQEMVRNAVVWSASAVAAPRAGEIDHTTLRRVQDEAEVKEESWP